MTCGRLFGLCVVLPNRQQIAVSNAAVRQGARWRGLTAISGAIRAPMLERRCDLNPAWHLCRVDNYLHYYMENGKCPVKLPKGNHNDIWLGSISNSLPVRSCRIVGHGGSRAFTPVDAKRGRQMTCIVALGAILVIYGIVRFRRLHGFPHWFRQIR